MLQKKGKVKVNGVCKRMSTTGGHDQKIADKGD